ncbi:maleylpyruvate isomerase N-terminal domain-containing protein [Pseudokineococcus basanitobsidens]|uniref:Maleylpyruvate isomerase N-terminal domain-containing protein n=1 Tax=Pseudokineococcus basanitobsidens TaxID=1926649 RepID=A0ABU8RHN2_9ACTN
MALTVPVDRARPAFLDSVTSFVDAVGALDELALLEASRCRGWTRLDVVVHVLTGWQEVLAGLVSPVDDPPTVDAASFWTAFADAADADEVAVLMAQRRRSAAYARPSAAVEHLRDVAGSVRRGTAAAASGDRRWLGEVFDVGDFLATWAVEDAVHQLDLRCAGPVPPDALALARETVEALAGRALPTDDHVEAVLVGTGRLGAPVGWGEDLRGRLPALG